MRPIRTLGRSARAGPDAKSAAARAPAAPRTTAARRDAERNGVMVASSFGAFRMGLRFPLPGVSLLLCDRPPVVQAGGPGPRLGQAAPKWGFLIRIRYYRTSLPP